MALYTLECRDRPASFDLRAATRPAHLEWIKAQAGIKLAGPWLDDQGRPTGSLFILEAESPDAVRAWAKTDPYAKANLFATVTVTPWRLVVGGFAD